jgi:ribonuclease R
MHRLGDTVEVRLVEAAPVAGALRFELLSEASSTVRRGRKDFAGRDDARRERRPEKAVFPAKARREKPAKSRKPKLKVKPKGKRGRR